MYTKQTLDSELGSGLAAIKFSSKHIKTDDFTGEIGNPYIQIIPGSLANYERGAEILHLKKNECLFNVASMKYILLNKVIPLKYITTFTKYMNIKRKHSCLLYVLGCTIDLIILLETIPIVFSFPRYRS